MELGERMRLTREQARLIVNRNLATLTQEMIRSFVDYEAAISNGHLTRAIFHGTEIPAITVQHAANVTFRGIIDGNVKDILIGCLGLGISVFDIPIRPLKGALLATFEKIFKRF